MSDSNKEIPNPKCFDNDYISLKHLNIQALQQLIENLNDVKASDTQHVKASFITSFGIVYADIESIQYDENNGISFNKDTKELSVDLSQMVFLRNRMIENEEKDYPEKTLELNQDGALINLKNVEIYSNSQSPIEMPQLLIYSDAILAMSYIVKTSN